MQAAVYFETFMIRPKGLGAKSRGMSICLWSETLQLLMHTTRIEGSFGQVAYAHLFVTSAMLSHLKKIFDLEGRPAILYDRPPSNFRRTDALQQHEVSDLHLAPSENSASGQAPGCSSQSRGC